MDRPCRHRGFDARPALGHRLLFLAICRVPGFGLLAFKGSLLILIEALTWSDLKAVSKRLPLRA